MDQEIERQPVAANLTKRPDDADRRGQQDGHRHRDPQQHPGVVPGEAVLVGLAEVDDLDVGKAHRGGCCSACSNGPAGAGSRATRPGCPASRPPARRRGWPSRSRAPAARHPRACSGGRAGPAAAGGARPQAARPGSRPAGRWRADGRRGSSGAGGGSCRCRLWISWNARPSGSSMSPDVTNAVDPVGPAPGRARAARQVAGDRARARAAAGPRPRPSSRRTPGPAGRRRAPARAGLLARAALSRTPARSPPRARARGYRCRSGGPGRRAAA